jgi:hypothetical protein
MNEHRPAKRPKQLFANKTRPRTGLNIAFLFFSATYVAFSGHFIEAAFYACGILASVALIKHPHFVRQGLSFSQPLAI